MFSLCTNGLGSVGAMIHSTSRIARVAAFGLIASFSFAATAEVVITTDPAQTRRVDDYDNDGIGNAVFNTPTFGGRADREIRGLYGFTISGGSTAADIATATSITLTTTVAALVGEANAELDFSVIGLADGTLDFAGSESDRYVGYGAAGTPLQSFTAEGLSVGSTITVTLNVTEFVKAQSLAGNPYANFRFQVTNPDTFPRAGANHEINLNDLATLTITPVPEPGSLGLVALSGLCLLAKRRRA